MLVLTLSATPIVYSTPSETSDLHEMSERAPLLHLTSVPSLSYSEIQDLSSFKDDGAEWTKSRSRSN